MSKPRLSRRLVASAAAYVIVLQALLLPLSVAVGSPLDGTLCASSASSAADQAAPGKQDPCGCAAGCGMPCCGQTLAAPPPNSTVPFPVFAAPAAGREPALVSVASPGPRQANLARGPPAA
jgi:hypothetical protein